VLVCKLKREVSVTNAGAGHPFANGVVRDK
jgi:hypothetical protein